MVPTRPLHPFNVPFHIYVYLKEHELEGEEVYKYMKLALFLGMKSILVYLVYNLKNIKKKSLVLVVKLKFKKKTKPRF